jgi:hypothetical protein
MNHAQIPFHLAGKADGQDSPRISTLHFFNEDSYLFKQGVSQA